MEEYYEYNVSNFCWYASQPIPLEDPTNIYRDSLNRFLATVFNWFDEVTHLQL